MARATQEHPMDESGPPAVLNPNRGAVANFEDPYAAHAGEGRENLQPDDLILPLLRVLQTKSPQVELPLSQGGLGAKAGQIINVSTNEIYDGEKGLIGVPVYYHTDYPEWTPRDAGGGLVARHALSDPLIAQLRARYGKFGKLPTDGGTELVETKYLYCIFFHPDDPSITFRAVPTFTSTQIKKVTGFMNNTVTGVDGRGNRFTYPLRAHKIRLTTKFESHKKGNIFGWVLERLDPDAKKCIVLPSDPLFREALDCYEAVVAGEVKAAAPTREPGEDPDDDLPM